MRILKILLLFFSLSVVYFLVFRSDYVCPEFENKLGCYKSILRFRMDILGVDNSKSYIKNLVESDYLTQGECHTLAHQLGQWAADDGVKMIEAMEQDSSFCGWGFFHGVLEGIFGEGGGHGEILMEDASQECEKIDQSDRLGIFNCFHALGHGSFAVDGNVNKSLDRCDAGADAATNGYCYDGVFMAQTFFERDPDDSGNRISIDPLALCDGMENQRQLYCFWRYAPINIFVEELKLPSKEYVQEISEKVPENLRKIFWNGFGRELDSRFASDEDIIYTSCAWGGSDFQSECVAGAAMHMIFYDQGDFSRANDLCREAPSENKSEDCLRKIQSTLYPGIVSE